MKVRLYLHSQPPLTFEGEEIMIVNRSSDYDLKIDKLNAITFAVSDFRSLIWDEKYFPELSTKDSAYM